MSAEQGLGKMDVQGRARQNWNPWIWVETHEDRLEAVLVSHFQSSGFDGVGLLQEELGLFDTEINTYVTQTL